MTAGPGDVGGPPTDRVVDGLVDLVLGAPRRYTREQVAAEAGVPLEEARRLWRAMGFADVGDAVAFTEHDVSALRLLASLMDVGLVDRVTAVDVARSLGQTTSRLADWQVDTFGRRLVDRGVIDPADPLAGATALREAVEDLVPALERLLVHGWRRQLAAALERGLADADPDDREAGHLTVGFADQVGFTRLARRLEESDLAALVERFESRSADVVVAHGGRVIKTLGDEILFVAGDAHDAVAASLALLEAHEADDTVPRLRIGLATGDVVTRRGDVFGTTVNLASRLTAVARPDSVLVDAVTAEALGGADDLRLRPLSPRAVRGLGLVRPVVVERR